MRFFFRKSQRLLKNEQFQAVLAHRCYACRGMVRFYASPNEQKGCRLGVSVSKACGHAVLRNQLKRYVREVFRQNQHLLVQDHDYLLIIKPKMTKQSKSQRINRRAETQKILSSMDFEQLRDVFMELAARVKKVQIEDQR